MMMFASETSNLALARCMTSCTAVLTSPDASTTETSLEDPEPTAGKTLARTEITTSPLTVTVWFALPE